MRHRFIISLRIDLFLSFLLFSFRINSLIFLLIRVKIEISKWRIQSYTFLINRKILTFFIITEIHCINDTFELYFLVFNNVRAGFSIVLYYFHIILMFIFNFLNSFMIQLLLWISSSFVLWLSFFACLRSSKWLPTWLWNKGIISSLLKPWS